MVTEKRIGCQHPTNSLILPYTKTHGEEAIKYYHATGRIALEWQELLTYDILAVNEDGEWVHTKFGLAVPRRNGKNEVIAIRELYGLRNGERILHTAHRTTTSRAAWERLKGLLEDSGIKEIKGKNRTGYKCSKSKGQETIELSKKFGGGKIYFRTRTTTGGLGEGFDLLIIDEAQEYQDDQESTLKYVVSDSKNPQTIMTGTPPTAVSTGTVFTRLRKGALDGLSKNTGWAEWSVDQKSNVYDKELWYLTNPSMGVILNERKVEDEIGNDDIDFNIQRLGLWIKYNQKSAISAMEWNKHRASSLPKLQGKLSVGIKYGHDGENVAMAIGVKTIDGDIFTECIDCQPIKAGNDWILQFLALAEYNSVIVDGANGQAILKAEMKKEGLKAPLLPTVKEVIEASASFEQGVYQNQIVHMGQKSLVNVVTNCEKRAIGSNGGFGYRSIKEGADVSLLDAVILAYWGAKTAKETKKQTIGY